MGLWRKALVWSDETMRYLLEDAGLHVAWRSRPGTKMASPPYVCQPVPHPQDGQPSTTSLTNHECDPTPLHLSQNAEGAGLAPFDCWLALRGLKTMALRMDRSADNAAALAEFLARHPLVKKVGAEGAGRGGAGLVVGCGRPV